MNICLKLLRLHAVSDEYLEKKVEFNRELALSKQQNEFMTKRITELQKQVDDGSKRYEEQISNYYLL